MDAQEKLKIMAAEYARARNALDQLYRAYGMIMPGVAHIAIQDYELLNKAPLEAQEVLRSPMPDDVQSELGPLLGEDCSGADVHCIVTIKVTKQTGTVEDSRTLIYPAHMLPRNGTEPFLLMIITFIGRRLIKALRGRV